MRCCPTVQNHPRPVSFDDLGRSLGPPHQTCGRQLKQLCTARTALTAMPVVEEPPPKTKDILPRPAVKGGPGSDGRYDWQGMWSPVNGPAAADGPCVTDLEKELSTYGDLTEFTYDNFVKSPDGKYHVAFKPADLLKAAYTGPLPPGSTKAQVLVPEKSPARGYMIEDDAKFYLYATSGIHKGTIPIGDIQDLSTNWIGYVAVSKEPDATTRKRDLAVVWRGTEAQTEWLTDITCEFARWDAIGGAGQDVDVEKGFEQLYRSFTSTPGNSLSLQGQVQVAVHKLLAKYPDIGSITTTGHSLGGALASLSAYDLAFSEINRVGDSSSGKLIPVTAFTFEAPRVGNLAYAEGFKAGADSQLKMLRVVNIPDVVPKMPYDAWTWKDVYSPLRLFRFLATPLKDVLAYANPPEAKFASAFHHGGVEYAVDTTVLVKEGKLKDVDWEPLSVGTLKQHHSLQLVLWLVDPSRKPFPLDPAGAAQ